MNRKTFRQLTKKIKRRSHCSRDVAQATAYTYYKMAEQQYQREQIEDGDKVKLDVNKITLSRTFFSKSKEYQDFVTNNRDTVFTVEFYRQHKTIKIFSLKEDKSEPKWLFACGDLIPVREGG